MKDNNHMMHLEDAVFYGAKTTHAVIEIAQRLLDSLVYGTATGMSVTVKVDGSPAVVIGRDSEDGRAFVSTKRALNVKRVLYKEVDEIESSDLNPSVQAVLKTLLSHFSDIAQRRAPGFAIQGDVVYHPECTSVIVAPNGKELAQSNVLAYPLDSEWKKHERMAVAWHTAYRDWNVTTIGDIRPAIPGVWSVPIDVPLMREPISPWYEWYGHVSSEIQKSKEAVASDMERIVSIGDAGPTTRTRLMREVNAGIRAGVGPTPHASIARSHACLTALKMRLLRILQTEQTDIAKPFVVVGDDVPDPLFKVEHEGFVVYDAIQRIAIKLVDRTSFSFMNFSDDFRRNWHPEP